MQVSTQLFIGDQEKRTFFPEQIRQKIISAKKYANIRSILIWADENPESYHHIVQICREYEIQTYLWFPVFADIPGYAPQEEQFVTSYEDSRGYGKIGRWDALGQGDEKFLFICPNNTPAVDDVLCLYTRLVDQVDFDGVFLDRIRYPSCTNGFELLFTCFCDFCRDKFSKLYDTTLDDYRQTIADFVQHLEHITPEEFNRYNSLESLWKSADLQQFFEFRNRNIFEAVKRFSEYARSKNKHVGLDLYTPSLAPFVAQDYALLSQCCDWIKPMSYCHVIGPAGVPLEISCLIWALEVLCPNLHEQDIVQFFERMLQVPLPKSVEAILAQGIPEEFVARELEKIENLSLVDDVRVYPGIEAVENPHFSLTIDQQILGKYLAHIHHRADGCIASWNLLYIPDENWKILGEISR
jgi:hypothetical protein